MWKKGLNVTNDESGEKRHGTFTRFETTRFIYKEISVADPAIETCIMSCFAF